MYVSRWQEDRKYKQLDKTKFILSIIFINKKITNNHVRWVAGLIVCYTKEIEIGYLRIFYNNNSIP